MRSPQRKVYNQHQAPPYRAGNNTQSDAQKAHCPNKSQKYTPPSPTTPMPQPPNWLNKPTPPTPNDRDDILSHDVPRPMRNPSTRRRHRTGVIDVRGHLCPEQFGIVDLSFRRTVGARGPALGDDGSQPILILQASVPRYLQPQYADQLDEDGEGLVRNGTLPALIERLIGTFPKSVLQIQGLVAQSTLAATNIDNKQYQSAFLMTFRSFMTADALFDALVGYYNLSQPDDLTASELEDWLERGKRPTQRRVLELFGDWLQSNHLLEEEPHIARRLTEFLQSITTTSNAKIAKVIQERIQDLVRELANKGVICAKLTLGIK